MCNCVINSVQNISFYAVDCAKELLCKTHTAASVAGLTSVVLNTLEDMRILQGFRGFAVVGETVREWSGATRLPMRLDQLMSGSAATDKDFCGCPNFMKIASTIALLASDWLHLVKYAFKWAIISAQTANTLAFNLTGTALKNVTFATGAAGWGADLIDAAEGMYENGPSIYGWLTLILDGARLGALADSRYGFTDKQYPLLKGIVTGVPMFLVLVREVVKHYNIQMPASWNSQGLVR